MNINVASRYSQNNNIKEKNQFLENSIKKQISTFDQSFSNKGDITPTTTTTTNLPQINSWFLENKLSPSVNVEDTSSSINIEDKLSSPINVDNKEMSKDDYLKFFQYLKNFLNYENDFVDKIIKDLSKKEIKKFILNPIMIESKICPIIVEFENDQKKLDGYLSLKNTLTLSPKLKVSLVKNNNLYVLHDEDNQIINYNDAYKIFECQKVTNLFLEVYIN